MESKRHYRILASEEDKKGMNVLDLTYDFSCRIVRLYQFLTVESDRKDYVLSKQLYRSGTSIGANVREARHAQSDADYLSKYSIALKEADETEYWICLLYDNGFLTLEQYESLHVDIIRILKILISIVKSIKQKVKR